MNSRFNAIDYVQQLQAAGVSRPEAEVHARAILNLVRDCTAPNAEPATLDVKVRAGLDAIEKRISGKLDVIEADLKTEISKLRAENADLRGDLKLDRLTSYITFVAVLVLFMKLVVP